MSRFKIYFIQGLLISLFLGVNSLAEAGDIEWSGIYRVEGVSINNAILDRSFGKTKEYGLHNLILRPRIVAADGIYIDAQFGLYENPLGNQMGSYLGDGPGSDTLTEAENDADIRFSQFYLTWVNEHWSLITGRTPMHFGLGMTHNSGRGLFDHFSDIRDIVGIKISGGNFYMFPMYAKVDENDITGADDTHEINIHIQYDNLDMDKEMGVFYQQRKADAGGNNAPTDALGGDNTKTPSELNLKNFNFYFKQKFTTSSFGIEVAQLGGETGIKNVDNENIKMSGFGVLGEFDYTPEGKKSYGVKFGYATGDDPNTDDDYEGFLFDRNYDVGVLLFNHGLGQANLLKTGLYGRTGDNAGDTVSTVEDQADVEGVSNTYYIAPYIKYAWSDRTSATLQFISAWLDSTDIDVNGTLFEADKELGFEVDFTLDYKFSEKIVWRNQAAVFQPGKAWEVDGNFDMNTVYGFVSKAAVSF